MKPCLIGLYGLLFAAGTMAGAEPVKTVMTADHALHLLLEGNRRFVRHRVTHPDQSRKRLLELEGGQHPFAVVLGCADSRVPPEVVFDQGLGDLFVIRVAGNVPDDEITGSIEYAVEHLGTPLVMVLGHEKCGAVSAAVQGGEAPGHIGSIVGPMKPSVDQARRMEGDAISNCVRLNVRRVVGELQSSEPILKELVHSGRLKVVGAKYDLHTGQVSLISE